MKSASFIWITLSIAANLAMTASKLMESCTFMENIETPEERLSRLYLEERLTTREIANRLGVCKRTVDSRLKAAGIQARPNGRGLANRGIEPPSKETLERLVNVEHRSYSEIGPMFGVDASAIHHWLRKHSIERKRPTPEEIRSLYESGMSPAKIGAKWRMSGGGITQFMRRHGIPRRRRGFCGTTQFRAKDGTKMGSSYEVEVANWLTDRSIPFIYEPSLPFSSTMKADFLVAGIFVEIWGVKHSAVYEERKERKREGYKAWRLPLVQFGPRNFSPCGRELLEKKLAVLEVAYRASAPRQMQSRLF